jgi:7,8-dihydropterin-6-yl-methyl-4-(beta-D-ribofuranosyl)aminobenzene 5'-phosphate synthase
VAERRPFESVGEGLALDESGEADDPLEDDQGLLLATPSGRVLVTGCAHSGVVSLVDAAARLMPPGPDIIVGGLHLRSASPDRLDRTIAALSRAGVARIHPCHCTGEAAEQGLAGGLGAQRVHPLRCGDQVSL